MHVRTKPMAQLDQGTPDSEDVLMCGGGNQWDLALERAELTGARHLARVSVERPC